MRAFSVFSAPGQWFRGNCHTHTTLSDGKSSPVEVAAAYREQGYDFLVLTDHRKSQESVAELSRKGFLVINGIEHHPPALKPHTAVPHHIVGIGIDKTPSDKWVRAVTADKWIRWVWRNGGIPVYAHPYWSGHDLDHMREGRRAFGVEVFNSVCEAERGLGDSSAHLDHALSEGIPWRVFAVDDMHKIQRDAFAGWIMVKARDLTRAAILRAILKGNFYATQGPEILQLSVRRGIARIECSPVHKIVWHCVGPYGRIAVAETALTEAEYDLRKRENARYLRVELIDFTGRKAWSQPVWRDARTGAWHDPAEPTLQRKGR